MTMQRDLVIKEDIRVFVPLVAGKPRGQQRFRQIRDFGNMDALLIQISSASIGIWFETDLLEKTLANVDQGSAKRRVE